MKTMLPAVALVVTVTLRQSASYAPATTPAPLAAPLCRAIDRLNGLNLLYGEEQFILAADDDSVGAFHFGLELKGKLIPLVEGNAEKSIVVKGLPQPVVGSAKHYEDGYWRYVKASIRALPRLTNRIRICVASIETTKDGGTSATVGIDTEGKASYMVVLENGVVTRIMESCLAPARFSG